MSAGYVSVTTLASDGNLDIEQLRDVLLQTLEGIDKERQEALAAHGLPEEDYDLVILSVPKGEGHDAGARILSSLRRSMEVEEQ